MHDLWRLSVWGISAAMALAIAIVAGLTDAGSERARGAALKLREAMIPSSSNPTRPLDATEGRMLAESVRLLTVDRERLVARIASLEHNVDDMTGSITRVETAMRAPTVTGEPAKPAPPPPAPPVAAALPQTVAPVHSLSATILPTQQTVALAQFPSAAIPSLPHSIMPAQSPPAMPPDPPQAATPAQSHSEVIPAPAQSTAPARRPAPRAVAPPPVHPQQVASKPPDDEVTSSIPTSDAPPEENEVRPPRSVAARSSMANRPFGLDLGSGRSEDALRANWNAALRRHGALLQGLRPVMAAREQPRGGKTYRLIAGPIDTAAKAARYCTAITTMGGICQPAVFEGQKLAAQ